MKLTKSYTIFASFLLPMKDNYIGCPTGNTSLGVLVTCLVKSLQSMAPFRQQLDIVILGASSDAVLPLS
ncbi:hypothetical protein [Cupriavidus alkaliphilus]|uniref:Uncharacterized protein n=1 Tax=Cupriavidus alkaliphilus TaxID=942866 RepID=A0A7W4VHD1_9BURK|nr:hypothetical protein [Cupriavidus alkaliphilus]MBB3011244.1 hypothetical protein [Cupriavidus alkaliphilus]